MVLLLPVQGFEVVAVFDNQLVELVDLGCRERAQADQGASVRECPHQVLEGLVFAQATGERRRAAH